MEVAKIGEKITQKMADAFINNEDARQANARVRRLLKFASWMDDYAREGLKRKLMVSFCMEIRCLDE